MTETPTNKVEKSSDNKQYDEYSSVMTKEAKQDEGRVDENAMKTNEPVLLDEPPTPQQETSNQNLTKQSEKKELEEANDSECCESPSEPVLLRRKSPPPGLSSSVHNRRRYTALVDDKGLVHFNDAGKLTRNEAVRMDTAAAAACSKRTETIQVDHLMHLLSSRLSVLEDISASVDKCVDSYELSARTKLEDCRNQLKQRVDEIVELYGREINSEISKRRKTLQQFERKTEEHLATTQKLLTQAKLKLSRMKITNEELRTLNDKILDALVKTRKLQRDSSEFDCWMDFIAAHPLQNDHCIGELQFRHPSSLIAPHNNITSIQYTPAASIVVNPSAYGETYDGTDHCRTPINNQMDAFNKTHNAYCAINGNATTTSLSTATPPTHIEQSFQQDFWENKNYMMPGTLTGAPPGLSIPINNAAAAALHSRAILEDSSLGDYDTQNAAGMLFDYTPINYRRSTGNWKDMTWFTAGSPSMFDEQKSLHLPTNSTPPPPPPLNCSKSWITAPVQLRRRMIVPTTSGERESLMFNNQNNSMRGVDNKRHSLGANLSSQFRGGRSGPLKPSLLSLDMQRPIVIDCYGDQPLRHLKCIKGLTFMLPNRLIICENGRKSGHKNVLMFSLTGTFLGYCGGPYSNPTGLARMSNEGLCVMDDGCLKVLTNDTFQIKQVLSLTDTDEQQQQKEHNNGSDGCYTSSSSSSSNTINNVLSRQDRFGGLFCTEQMVYICDRKNPAIKVYDIRAGCRPILTWNGNSAAATIGKSAARQSHPNLLPFSNPNFVHRKNDYIYVSDSGTNSVFALTLDGKLIGDLKSLTSATNQQLSTSTTTTAASSNIFNNPCGICDDGENLAVADLYNNRIQLFSRHCLIGSIYSPCIESPFSLSYNPIGVLAISNGRPRTVTLYFTSAM